VIEKQYFDLFVCASSHNFRQYRATLWLFNGTLTVDDFGHYNDRYNAWDKVHAGVWVGGEHAQVHPFLDVQCHSRCECGNSSKSPGRGVRLQGAALRGSEQSVLAVHPLLRARDEPTLRHDAQYALPLAGLYSGGHRRACLRTLPALPVWLARNHTEHADQQQWRQR
jgi:hypothetical protein